MDDHTEQRRADVLDGKRAWEAKDFGSDHDRFFVEVIRPLRALEARGLFEGLDEHEAGIEGTVRIFAAEITGAVNYEFRTPD